MSDGYEVTGGSQVGWMSASWPFAKLTASPASLSLRVHFVGNYSFRPDEVISITAFTLVPFFAWGVKIEHCNPDCPKRLLFWSFQSPKRTLEGIQGAGFRAEGNPSAAAIPYRGFAIRWQVIVIAVVVWNGLFILDASRSAQHPATPGPLSLIAMIALFTATIATFNVPGFQRLVLKPGRKVDEVRHLLKLLAGCAGLGSLMLLLFLLVKAAKG